MENNQPKNLGLKTLNEQYEKLKQSINDYNIKLNEIDEKIKMLNIIINNIIEG